MVAAILGGMPSVRDTRQVRTTGQLFAVIDDPREGAAALADLQRAGVPQDRLTLLRGEEGAARIDASGDRSVGARIRQVLSFTIADQMPDFAVYEAAVLDGRSVIAVRVADQTETSSAREILRAHGAHFINRYGSWMTEELDVWRGPELDIPALLRR
jgi:hypothetical protein